MGLDPKLLNSMPDTLVKLYSEVEESILQDMARRLMAYDYYLPAAQYQEQKLRELGLCRQDIVKRLSQITGKSQQELRQMMNEAGETVVKQDVDYYKLADVYEPSAVDAEALYKRLNSGLKQTNGAFTNITRTMANTATGQFETALDKAWLQVSSGTFDHNTAVRNAVKGLAKQGIQAIQCPSGRTDSIEVAVRRAVVTGLNQTAMHVSMELADELGVDLVEVSAHSGARPEHAVWQGKCYSRNGRKVIDGVVYEDLRKATGYGTGAGLGGWNCRHSISPYVHGAARAYSDEQLKEYDAKKIRYNGKMYTEYETSQIQRSLERDIRRWKRENAALSAIGEDTTVSALKTREKQAELRSFINQTGLKRQSSREQIGGYGKNLAPASPKFVNRHDKLFENASKVKPISGYTDVVIHGDKTGFAYNDIDGRETNVSVKELAEMLTKSEDYKGGDIRLLSCEAAAEGSLTAQGLADILGVNVYAPTDVLYVSPDGDLLVSSDGLTNDGGWIIVKPRTKKAVDNCGKDSWRDS